MEWVQIIMSRDGNKTVCFYPHKVYHLLNFSDDIYSCNSTEVINDIQEFSLVEKATDYHFRNKLTTYLDSLTTMTFDPVS